MHACTYWPAVQMEWLSGATVHACTGVSANMCVPSGPESGQGLPGFVFMLVAPHLSSPGTDQEVSSVWEAARAPVSQAAA